MKGEMEVLKVEALLPHMSVFIISKSPFLRTGFGNCLQKGCDALHLSLQYG
jgi:hypothetical protein